MATRAAVARIPCALLLSCLLIGLVHGAESDRQSVRIREIELRKNYLLARAQVLDALGLQEGGQTTPEELQRAVERFNAEAGLGILSYRMEPAPEGRIDLVFELDERVTVGGVSFRGNRKISDRRLAETAAIVPGEVVSALEVRVLEGRIVEAYQRMGYPLASSRAVLRAGEGDQGELVFYVAEGPRVYVQDVAFIGNRQLGDDVLRDVMRSKVRHWPALIWPGWFDEQTFRDDLVRVETEYREHGYLDAEVAGDLSYSDDMRRITLNVIVHEGAQYRIGQILFEGNTLFRADELQDAVPVAPGQPYRPSRVERSLQTIAELYAGQGHMDVTERKGNLRAEPVYPAEGAHVELRFVIDEGQPVFVRRVRIEGLSKTREDVVRRNLNIYPGERATSVKIEESERLLRNTGYFDPEARDPVQITLEPDEGALRDAVVRVQEGPTGRFLIGAGVGSESGLLGEFSLVEENFDLFNWPSSWADLWRGNAFRGGGHRLSVVIRAGTERSYFSVSFRNPSVWNTEYSFGTDIYSTAIVRNEFDESRTGFSLSGGEGLGKFARRSVTVGYESIDIDDVDAGAAAEIMKDEGSHAKPFVRFDISVDRRDNRFMPTEGYAARGTAELAAGDVDALKLEAGGEKHWPVLPTERGPHVVGVRGRIGVVIPYSGGRVPVFERFYAGGFSTLRGFEFEGVSPIDPPTGDQVGGEGLLIGSAEYSVPVSEDGRFRVLGFLDGGYVTEDAEDVLDGWDELRLSTGVGFRWQVPFLGMTTLEINLATALREEDGDDTQTLHFSFGAQRRF